MEKKMWLGLLIFSKGLKKASSCFEVVCWLEEISWGK
jgi:hypothetical protein